MIQTWQRRFTMGDVDLMYPEVRVAAIDLFHKSMSAEVLRVFGVLPEAMEMREEKVILEAPEDEPDADGYPITLTEFTIYAKVVTP